MDGRWIEVGDGVFARRHGELDLTTGLVLGADRALVIDTRGDDRQGAELLVAIREITGLSLVVAITHAHFDHCFGTAAFAGAGGRPTPRGGRRAFTHDAEPSSHDPRPTVAHHDAVPVTPRPPLFAQSGCAAAIRATADEQRRQWVDRYREAGDHATADALACTDPVLPDHPVCPRPGDRHTLELGGRAVVLTHPGPGHTDHDLAMHVPDAGVLFAGDLLENGAPPSHGDDAHPDRWPDAVARLLEIRVSSPRSPRDPRPAEPNPRNDAAGDSTASPAPTPEVFVPGHGAPMNRAQVAEQLAELQLVAALWHAVACGELTSAQAAARTPHPGIPWPPATGH